MFGIPETVEAAEKKIKTGFYIVIGMLAIILWRVWK